MMRVKIILAILLVTIQLNAVNQQILEGYIKKYMQMKMHSSVEKIETISSYVIPNTKGWEVYFLSLEMYIQMGSVTRKRTVNQTVFTRGKQVTFSLKDKNGKNYAQLLKPRVPMSAYDSEHLLVGNANARHKVLVFSDPFCPFCQEIMPPLFKTAKRYPNTLAVYYYHLPLLRIHPASAVVTKAMHYFHQQGDLERLIDLYHLPISERERDTNTILKAIREKTGVPVRMEMIDTQLSRASLARDLEMKKRLMVTGTPTVFLDGSWDPSRFAYKNYIPR